MTKTFEAIVFFGSGPVAAKSLELLSENFNVEAVITKPKPAHHHGSFPVIDVTEKLKLPVHTVSNKGELSEMIAKSPFKSRLGVLIDFGIIVAQDVIDYFPLGIVNSHFSILPEWRGADPITFAILSGQETTGVSLMLLVEAMDEGPLISYGEHSLFGDETTPELTERLINLSDALLVHDLPRLQDSEANPMPQSITGRLASYSRKLTKDDGIIDWNKPAEQLEREIRAFIEWPKSRTVISGRDVILTSAHTEKGEGLRAEGEVFITPEGQLAVQTSNDLLIIDKLKPAGKREMSAKEFLVGYKI